MFFYNQNFHTFHSTLLNTDSITSAFGTKINGDGRKKETIRKLLKNARMTYGEIVIPHQSHSLSINVVTSETSHQSEPYDGLITHNKGVVLTIITADCSPIIYSDPFNGVIGISHQGWKGTLGMLPQLMIEKMIDSGAELKNISCAIGPTINECCYEIYGERKKEFQEKFGSEIFNKNIEKITLNLMKANAMTLLKTGIKKENIDFFPFCTSCDKEKFYSYHRDKGIEGEMVSFIVQ